MQTTLEGGGGRGAYAHADAIEEEKGGGLGELIARTMRSDYEREDRLGQGLRTRVGV